MRKGNPETVHWIDIRGAEVAAHNALGVACYDKDVGIDDVTSEYNCHDLGHII